MSVAIIPLPPNMFGYNYAPPERRLCKPDAMWQNPDLVRASLNAPAAFAYVISRPVKGSRKSGTRSEGSLLGSALNISFIARAAQSAAGYGSNTSVFFSSSFLFALFSPTLERASSKHPAVFPFGLARYQLRVSHGDNLSSDPMLSCVHAFLLSNPRPKGPFAVG